jgi:ATP-dependent Clp protease ATP-binding subunit ClpB
LDPHPPHAFRFDKLTIKAQEAVQRAQSLAADRGNPELDPLHLLSALLAETEGIVRPVLEKIGVNVGQLSRLVDGELSRMPQASGGSAQSQPGDDAGRRVGRESAAMKDEFIRSSTCSWP